MNLYARNIWLFYALSFLQAFVYAFSVIHVLFLQAVHFSFTQISVLFSVWALTFVVTEIFTGMFADIYGRKKAIVISSFFRVAALSLYVFFSGYYFIFFALILFALGASFYSGSSDSLLFESLRKLGRKKEYKKVLSRNYFIFIALGILTNFFIPLLFEQSIRLPFYIAGSFAVISAICGLLLFDPTKRRKRKSFMVEYKKQFVTSFRVVLSNKFLSWLIIFAAVLGLGIGFFGDVLNQPLIKEGRTLYEYGVVFALAAAVQSLLSFKLEKIIDFAEKIGVYMFLIVIYPVGLLLLLLPFATSTIVILGVLWTVGLLRTVFFSSEINRLVKDSERATVHSINSMFDATVFLVVAPVLGMLLDVISLTQGLVFIAILSFVLPGLVLLFKPKALSF